MGKLDGSCLCGNVTYTCDADPIASANCHCRDCQRASGAPFTTNVIVPEASVEIRGETLSVFQTTGDGHGKQALRRFCSNCGSQLIVTSEGYPGFAFIKSGTLNDTSLVRPGLDIWADSKQPWTDHGERVVAARDPSPEVVAQLAG